MTIKPKPTPRSPGKAIRLSSASKTAARVVLATCLPLLLLAVVLLLTCCASAPSSTKRSIEPIPVVTCDEHSPVEHLPRYPEPDLRIFRPVASLDDARAVIAGYSADSTSQQAWAVAAAGVAERERAKRVRTANCLDAYRARGVIL